MTDYERGWTQWGDMIRYSPAPFHRRRLIMKLADEVPFESVYASGPEPTERSQPGIHLLKWSRFQPVETALCVHRGLDETGVAQHSQVLGHGRLRHTKLTLDLSHRLFGRDQQAQYRAAVRLRNDFEWLHAFYILYRAYTCQGILRKFVTLGGDVHMMGLRRDVILQRSLFIRP